MTPYLLHQHNHHRHPLFLLRLARLRMRARNRKHTSPGPLWPSSFCLSVSLKQGHGLCTTCNITTNRGLLAETAASRPLSAMHPSSVIDEHRSRLAQSHTMYYYHSLPSLLHDTRRGMIVYRHVTHTCNHDLTMVERVDPLLVPG